MNVPAHAAHGPADAALEVLRSDAAGRPVATTLSVDEAVLLDQVDFDPVGLYSGASVVQVASLARLGVGYSDNGELVQLSQALEASRVRAVARLAAAGRAGGADGVVGVSLDIGDLGSGSRLVRMVATGTGVRVRGTSRRPAVPGGCFTASLSGQELHLLSRAGYHPLGIVSGVCAYHIGRRAFGAWAGSVRDNQEMTLYTEALYDARELAMGRLQDMALALGAGGVVGVSVTEKSGVWGSHAIEFAAIGTAVVVDAGGHRPLSPKMVMELAERR